DYHSTSLINLKATTSVGSVVTYKISVEAVSRAGVSQSYFAYDMQMPTSNPILQVYLEGTTKRFFLNGSPTTALAIKTLLGIDLDSANDQE
ncbi:MAG: hypothetical protein H7326_09530, partial [Bdellovibrionaceae bacterium]|nr:hypothetical protein [Pseudobdellovibrionaceae bacterium]